MYLNVDINGQCYVFEMVYYKCNELYGMKGVVISLRYLSYIVGFFPAVPQLHSFGLKASRLLREGNSLSVNASGNAAQASTSAVEENVLEWVKKDNRRMLHVVYRVGDLDRTIKYLNDPLWYSLIICEYLYFAWVTDIDDFQILHGVSRNEVVEKTWHTRGKIH